MYLQALDIRCYRCSLWQLLYLHWLDVLCCRCSFWGPTHLQLAFLWTCRCFSACLSCTIASTSWPFWDLRILSSQILHLHSTFSMTWGCFSLKLCIRNLLFPWLADTPHQNFASPTCSSHDLQIPHSEIWHLQSLKIHYRRCRHKNCILDACPAKFCSLIHQACNNVQAENKLNTFQWIW